MPDEEPPLPAPAFPPAPPSAPPVAGLNMCIHQFPQKPAAFFGNISNWGWETWRWWDSSDCCWIGTLSQVTCESLTCAFTSESTCELYLRLVHVLVSLPVSLNLTCVFTCVFGELVTWDYLAWIQGQRCEGEGWISGGATSRWRKGSGEWWYSGNGYRSCTCEGGGAGNWWGWGDARQLERDLPEAEEEGHQDDWWVEKSEED